LKSTSIFGGVQLINIVLGIIRNKLTAIILGSVGIGLISLYQSVIDLTKSVSTLGIETSGIREIAQSAQNKEDLSITISVIRRWILLFAIIGTLLCILFSSYISQWIFDSKEYTLSIAILSFSIFFSTLAAGEVIILQGMEKIAFIAKATVLFNIVSLIVAISLYWLWGNNAIITVFIISSIISFVFYAYYRKRLDIRTQNVTSSILISKGKSMLKIGFYIVIATIQTELTLLIIKGFIINRTGIESMGFVQATRTISSVYFAIILGAMSIDFFPRLSAFINNRGKVRKLINEQIHILLLLSTPITIILIIGSRIALRYLYTSEFMVVADLLHWQLLGVFFKIISWGFGLALLARGKGTLFLLTDTAFNILYIGGCYLLFSQYGINSVGISFFIAYVFYLIATYIILYLSMNFRWSKRNLKTILFSIIMIVCVFVIAQLKSNYLYAIGIPICLVTIIYSAYKLNKILPMQSLIDKFLNNKKSS